MLSQIPYTVSHIAAAPMMETITSRFGEIMVDTSKAIHFPYGLLGMQGKSNFVITAFPNPKMQQFKLLQSLDNHAISFITLPVAMQNGIINYADLQGACKDLQMEENTTAVLLIVTVHRTLDKVKLSVNARAPLLLDSENRVGAQYVYQSEQYKVQHML